LNTVSRESAEVLQGRIADMHTGTSATLAALHVRLDKLEARAAEARKAEAPAVDKQAAAPDGGLDSVHGEVKAVREIVMALPWNIQELRAQVKTLLDISTAEFVRQAQTGLEQKTASTSILDRVTALEKVALASPPPSREAPVQYQKTWPDHDRVLVRRSDDGERDRLCLPQSRRHEEDKRTPSVAPVDMEDGTPEAVPERPPSDCPPSDTTLDCLAKYSSSDDDGGSRRTSTNEAAARVQASWREKQRRRSMEKELGKA
jgi:hypothetical protein